jgi:hypothetical protein
MTMRLTLPTFTLRARPMRSVLGGVGLALGLAGCSGDSAKPFEPITDPAQVFNRLVLNIGAVNLSLSSPSNTFQLTATPLNSLGESMEGLPAPTFLSTDTTKVQVSPTGLLTAVETASDIMVITKLTTPDNIAHEDTAFVNVNATTDPAPELATLSIDPVLPDSGVLAIPGLSGDFYVFLWAIQIYATDAFPSLLNNLKETTADDTPIPDLATEYLSLDPAIATVDRRTGDISALAAGRVRLVARTAAYGVVKADTVTYTITPPNYQKSPLNATAPILGPAIVLRQGGIVIWAEAFPARGPVSLVFDDPSAAVIPSAAICDVVTTGGDFGSGLAQPMACAADLSMDTTEGSKYRVRQFPNPGTFTYHDMLSGATGKVIVMDSTTWLQ